MVAVRTAAATAAKIGQQRSRKTTRRVTLQYYGNSSITMHSVYEMMYYGTLWGIRAQTTDTTHVIRTRTNTKLKSTPPAVVSPRCSVLNRARLPTTTTTTATTAATTTTTTTTCVQRSCVRCCAEGQIRGTKYFTGFPGNKCVTDRHHRFRLRPKLAYIMLYLYIYMWTWCPRTSGKNGP